MPISVRQTLPAPNQISSKLPANAVREVSFFDRYDQIPPVLQLA